LSLFAANATEALPVLHEVIVSGDEERVDLAQVEAAKALWVILQSQ
jgi:hypothetical protein